MQSSGTPVGQYMEILRKKKNLYVFPYRDVGLPVCAQPINGGKVFAMGLKKKERKKSHTD